MRLLAHFAVFLRSSFCLCFLLSAFCFSLSARCCFLFAFCFLLFSRAFWFGLLFFGLRLPVRASVVARAGPHVCMFPAASFSGLIMSSTVAITRSQWQCHCGNVYETRQAVYFNRSGVGEDLFPQIWYGRTRTLITRLHYMLLSAIDRRHGYTAQQLQNIR